MDYKPLYISLGLIIIIGVILPLILLNFTETKQIPDENSILSPVINIIENGVTIFSFNIDLFSFFGETIKTNLITYLSAFAFIPNIILIPLLIIIITGILYTFIKLLPTT